MKRMRAIMTFGLALWCAGAGCIMVSYARETSPAVMAPAESAKASIAAASPHSSCHRAKTSPARRAHTIRTTAAVGNVLGERTAPSDVMNCCPLISGAFVPASRSQTDDAGSLVFERDGLSLPSLNGLPQSMRGVPLRLPNQNQLYLHGCSFLI